MNAARTVSDDQFILLSPGPACTSNRVKQAMLRGDWCHREPEFSELLGTVRNDLTRLLGIASTHEAILVTGSGTAGMELAIISSVRQGRSLLALRNGVYGDRLAAIAEAHGITVHSLHQSWTEPIDPELVRAALAAHPDVDAVSCVQHETTTGLLNPVDQIGTVVAESDAVFVLDAISATAIEPIGHERSRANFIGGTANKGLHGLPGMSFVLIDGEGERRMREVRPRSVYFDASAHLDGQRNGEVLFTPAVQVCFALREALIELEEAGGVTTRNRTYRQRATRLRDGLRALGFSPLVAESHRANSVSIFPLPPRLSYQRLHAELKRDGYIIYAGQARYAADYFRIATMGELPLHAIDGFLRSFESVVTAHSD
jgi:2-aminoethylphosphonate-pyruvate transaminase